MTTDVYIDYGNYVIHSVLTHAMHIIVESSNNIKYERPCAVYHLDINYDGSGSSKAYVVENGFPITKDLTKDEVDTMLKLLSVSAKQ